MIRRDSSRLDINPSGPVLQVLTYAMFEPLSTSYTASRRPERLEIYNAETQEKIYQQHHKEMPSVDALLNITETFRSVLNDLVTLSQYFNVKTKMPDGLTGQKISGT